MGCAYHFGTDIAKSCNVSLLVPKIEADRRKTTPKPVEVGLPPTPRPTPIYRLFGIPDVLSLSSLSVHPMTRVGASPCGRAPVSLCFPPTTCCMLQLSVHPVSIRKYGKQCSSARPQGDAPTRDSRMHQLSCLISHYIHVPHSRTCPTSHNPFPILLVKIHYRVRNWWNPRSRTYLQVCPTIPIMHAPPRRNMHPPPLSLAQV